MATIALIIVNWNSGNCLNKCLEAVFAQSLAPDRIIVIDNLSTDSSATGLAQSPKIKFIQSPRNLGFAVANNIAIRQCNEDFVALLNPDAYPRKDWLENLHQTIQSDPNIAASGSVQLSAANPLIIDGIGDVYHCTGLVWRCGYNEYLADVDLSKIKIFSACAAAAIYRRSALVEAGLFDEDFFCYVEDVDLGFRLRLLGYEIVRSNFAVVEHVGSYSTGGGRSDFSIFYGHRNVSWTFVKNLPFLMLIFLLPAHVLMSTVVFCHLLFAGKALVFVRAKIAVFKGMKKILLKRKIVQSKREITYLELAKQMSWQIFRK